MTTVVRATTGPDTVNFLYLIGEIEGYPQCSSTRAIALARLADGSLNIADEKAALIAQVEQNLTNWQAAQAALENL